MDVTLTRDGVNIRVLDGPYLSAGAPTPRAVADYTHLVARLDALKGFAADRLLETYNGTWLDEEIGEVDRPGFVAGLQNPSITLYDELGSAVVYFDDGGLFAGHWIEVSTENLQPVHAGIVG